MDVSFQVFIYVCYLSPKSDVLFATREMSSDGKREKEMKSKWNERRFVISFVDTAVASVPVLL